MRRMDECLFSNSCSPLLQYRQRVKRNLSMYQKTVLEGLSPIIPVRFPLCENPYVFPISEINLAAFSTPQNQQVRKPSPTSPLYIWRQNKLKNAILNGSLYDTLCAETVANQCSPFPPELALYRGRRSYSSDVLPKNLCYSLEKLFRSQSECGSAKNQSGCQTISNSTSNRNVSFDETANPM